MWTLRPVSVPCQWPRPQSLPLSAASDYGPLHDEPDYLLRNAPFKYMYVHVLMRDEKEGRNKKERSKQARSNKQQGKATQHTQGSHFS